MEEPVSLSSISLSHNTDMFWLKDEVTLWITAAVIQPILTPWDQEELTQGGLL